ncbi:hypothetical protein PIB30_068783 [Stylosanthes scabra]|uniref:Aminotransferase-like plant mobile domain-containing protein n=1 Tax=Stylosanthes scabra TaxID=79078 RepID=A0ABU6SND9_9FABA|nr:hypothetical protein [Stylosanthes scabra]
MAPRGCSRKAARAEPAPAPAEEAGPAAPTAKAPQDAQSLHRLNREWHIADDLMKDRNTIHKIYSGSAQSLPTSTLSQSRLRSSTKPPSFKVLDKPLQQEHLNLTPHEREGIIALALFLPYAGSGATDAVHGRGRFWACHPTSGLRLRRSTPDVAYHLGLHTDGEPVGGCMRDFQTHYQQQPWNLVEQYLETADADLDTLRQYARCYILLFIGGYIMPDKSSNLVHIRWLSLLRDFPTCARLSWGSVVLALPNSEDPRYMKS